MTSIVEPLQGKVALVTGAAAVSAGPPPVALAKVGAVSGGGITRPASQEAEAVSASAGHGRPGHGLPGRRVDHRRRCPKWSRQIEIQLGPVAVLVNNAGIIRPQPIDKITEQDWDEVLAVNLKSVFLVTQAVLPGMRAAKWGRIINLSSVAAQTGGVIGPHYTASKAGIIGLTHSYAALLAKEGVTVNSIAPALIETDMIRDNPRATPALIPVGRFGTVDEVADVVVMLVTNGYITGRTINVNGGWFMS